MRTLLTIGNPKTAKGESLGYLTGILHLAPAEISGRNVCAYAGACKVTCLNTAGRGIFPQIQAARLAKTQRFFADRAQFMADLAHDIAALVRKAAREGLIPAVRLNGTSDIPWERVPAGPFANIMAQFPSVQFYDYTKYPASRRRDLPRNYHLTHSLDAGEASEAHALAALAAGRNVAVPFTTRRGADLPTSFTLQGRTFPVIDGDTSDLRFLDMAGVIVGLRAKGFAKGDTSGFVREPHYA